MFQKIKNKKLPNLAKGLGTALLALNVAASPVKASNLEESLQAIKEEVKANPTSTKTNNPLCDTVSIYSIDRLTIKVCDEFIAFETKGVNKDIYFYDEGCDGLLDRVVEVDGRVLPEEEELIEANYFSTHRGIMEEFESADAEHRIEGRTPYNTRQVYIFHHGDKVLFSFNFSDPSGYTSKGGWRKIREWDNNYKWAVSLQRLYEKYIKTSKTRLGIN